MRKTLYVLCMLLAVQLMLVSCGQKEKDTSSEVIPSVETTESTAETSTEKTTESEIETSTEEASSEEEISEAEALLKENYPDLFLVTVASLNVRETPSVSGALIGAISENSAGRVLDRETEGWLHIQSGSVEGYVSAQYTLTGEEAYEKAAAFLSERVRVTDEIVNIRQEATTESKVLAAARAGAVYELTGEDDYFYEILLNGQKAYISTAVAEKGMFLREAVALDRTETEETCDPESQEETSSETDVPESGMSETESQATAAPETLPPETQVPETQAPVVNTGGLPARITPGSNGLTVCIDAGHQQAGISEKEPNGPGSSVMKAKLTTGTAGCVTGQAEYVVNLQVALKLEQVLLSRGYGVVMIRTDNNCPYSNAERAVAANNSGANCFIRIHCNSLSDPSVTGVINYAPTAGNPYMNPGVIAQSQAFANNLAAFMCAATGAQNRGIISGDEMTGINWCQVPVSLVEMGFMSNPDEDRKLCDDGYQNLLVQGMANGIDAYFGIAR